MVFLSVDIIFYLVVGIAGMPREQFHHGLEFRNMSIFVVGSLRAGSVPTLEKLGPQRQRGQLSPRHGIGPGPFQHTHGAGTRIFGFALSGRTLRHDIFVLFHEGQEPWHQGYSELGEQPTEKPPSIQFHSECSVYRNILKNLGGGNNAYSSICVFFV